ncbi:MAG TPA: PGPGW domain-containing protein [Candidatus Angelobacter sp.]|nr:PGPGW domain-containing protein [Candidatus Angelobacter sp.]
MIKRVALIAAGWALLVVGAAGIFLPVLPGILFLLIGLYILSMEYAWARRWVDALLRRFPAVARRFHQIVGGPVKPSSVELQ